MYKILIVDDSPSNIVALTLFISLFKDLVNKIKIDTVVDGNYAVEIFKKRNYIKQDENFNMIIMDLYMKQMDGDVATFKVYKLYLD